MNARLELAMWDRLESIRILLARYNGSLNDARRQLLIHAQWATVTELLDLGASPQDIGAVLAEHS